ncbi:MAG: SDR family oxidoreductase [Actinomycetota bacterium]|nr:SDR family oxidoreductase [Acidimicrobiia bacterium]MDQ3293901.1 SDR family oxidoreductase [Actinomycetota bacterium]
MAVAVDGARVLITGASSGIGWATAEALAAAGATVAVSARRARRLDDLVTGLPGRGHVALPADLADLDAAAAVAVAAWEALGHLDVVVHNAAIPKRRHVTALTPAEVEETMRLNYLAPVRVALVTLPRMLARGSGCQVFVSSLGGRLPIVNEAAYSGSKYALCGFAESMAVDLHASPVDVRLVLPGPIATEIWDQPGNDPPLYDGPLEPPSLVADAIVAAIEGDAFEVYAPDMKGVVEWKTSDPDAYIAGVAAMARPAEATP